MNMDQIINMVTRTIMRRAVNKGIDAGIGAVGRASKRRQPNAAQLPEPVEKQPEVSAERQRIREIRQARRAARAKDQG